MIMLFQIFDLILMLFVRLFDLCLFGFVGFLFLLGSGKGCGLWLWHSLDFSLTFCFYQDASSIWEGQHSPKSLTWVSWSDSIWPLFNCIKTYIKIYIFYDVWFKLTQECSRNCNLKIFYFLFLILRPYFHWSRNFATYLWSLIETGQTVEKLSCKDFSSFSSGDHFDFYRKIILVILVLIGHMHVVWLKLAKWYRSCHLEFFNL